MISEKSQDIASSLLLLAASGGLWLYMSQWPAKSALYPKFILGGIAAFSFISLILNLLEKNNEGKSDLPDAESLKRLLKFLSLVLAYAVLIPILGWVISSAIYLCSYVKLNMGFKPKSFIIIIVSLLVFRWLLSRFMYLEMPSGIIGLW
jgi:hypothetical protein